MKKATECENMDEVRIEIDRLDKAIVDLLAERWTYVDQAWVLKKSPEEATVPWRINAVIEKVKERAEEKGMPPQLAEALWHQIIAWGIQHEEERLREK